MTTTGDLIAACRRQLIGRGRQAMNVLAGSITANTTTVPLSYDLGGIQAGATISVGLEVMLVWQVDQTAKTATVQRGMDGSTPQAHTSGDLILVNPTFTDFEIFTELNNELLSLSAPGNGLFQVKTIDLTAVSGRQGYDFPASGFINVLEVRWQQTGTVSQNWPLLTDWEVSENLPTTGTFPSGMALFLTDAQPTAQQPIRVRYKSTFGALASLTDDVAAVTGLPVTALDIPPLGAALRVMAGRPNQRARFDTQGDTRRADEVRVGEVLQAPAALRQARQQRIDEEAARLTEVWGMRARDRVRL